MPWLQTDPMSERFRFVLAAREENATFASLCALFGVAPKTGYKWMHQYDSGGLEALRDRSRRPKGNSRRIPEEVAREFIALRHAHPTWGAKKLVGWVKLKEPERELPAPSTVGELLKQHGLVKARKRVRHQTPRTEPLRHADKPNAVWAMDFKGWFRLGDGARCDPLTITDAFSRYLICCKAGAFLGDAVGRDVWFALLRAFEEHGIPDAIRVDNGQPWAAPKGRLGLTRLAVKILKADIALERIRPGKPQENGRHERFHLTLKQDTATPPAENMQAQQTRFDVFQREYNDERPHEALRQRPPREFFAPSTRPYPGQSPDPQYPSWYEVLTPSHEGNVRFQGEDYFISTALRRERLGFVEVEEGCFEIHYCKMTVGRIHTSHPELGLIPN